jgi:hypothetical protein
MNAASTILKQLCTGKDNETHDIVRWLALIVFLTALGLAGYDVWKNGKFDLQQFGVGMSTLFASIGAALKLKETTEPTPEKKE